jgi:hypothetical protein
MCEPSAGGDRQDESEADERHERANGAEQQCALRRAVLADRQQTQRGDPDAGADEEEHAD